jgi:hypothetical protein
MTTNIPKTVPKKEAARLLQLERKHRASGQWGQWETIPIMPGTVGNGGWAATVTTCHKNRVFAVLDRTEEIGVRHLAVSSLSGIRPTWPEMQRIKNELAGPDATAIEVYPPQADVVDEADMFHLWILRGKLPFGLHKPMSLPGLRSPVILRNPEAAA